MLALAPFAFVLPLGTLLVFLLAFDVRKSPVQSALLVGLCFAVALYLCALAVYRRHFCKGGAWATVALCAAAAMIHPVAVLAIILIAFSPKLASAPLTGAFVCLVITLASSAIASLVLPSISGSGNALLGYLADAIEAFLGYDSSFTGVPSFNRLVNWLFMCLWIVLLCCVTLPRLKALPIKRSSAWDGDDPGAADVIGALVLACAPIAVGLLAVFGTNGLRIVHFMFPLAQTQLCIFFESHSPARTKKGFIYACVAILVAFGLLALHFYSIYYGLEDPASLVSTALFGIPGAIFGGSFE